MGDFTERRRSIQGIVLFAFLTLWCSSAAAAEVVLARPAGADAFMAELFNRLRGELLIHAFSVREDVNDSTPPSLNAAEELLGRTGADACVFLSGRGETSVVHVWVATPSAPPALFEAAAVQRTPDVPTILAVRTVDMLTAALGARSRSTAADSPAVADRPTAEALSSSVEYRRGWSVDAGLTSMYTGTAFGAAWGPRILLLSAPLSRIRVGVQLAGPLLGAQHTSDQATVDLAQAYAIGQVHASMLQSTRWTLDIAAGVGGYFYRGTGAIRDGIGSMKSGQADAWALASSVTGLATVALSRHILLSMNVQGLILLPRPRVVVGQGQSTAAFAWVVPSLAVGIRFAF